MLNGVHIRRLLKACAGVLLLAQICCSSGGDNAVVGRRVLVLGLDGLDHGIVTRMLAAGQLPHLARLARQGGFARLETSVPPQSPTAWSNFITGQRAGHHGIFDFIQRDPANLEPYLSTSRMEQGRRWRVGRYNIPLGGGQAVLLRHGKPFWWHLSRAGVPATVIKMPAHFPPRDDGEARVLSDMGTPDLLGTYGTFTVLTTDGDLAGKDLSGGAAVLLRGAGRWRYQAQISGPPNPFSAAEEPLTLPVTVATDPGSGGALITLGERKVVLGQGQWSEFVPVEFSVLPAVHTLRGMARLYLKSIHPLVTIYVSPINIDPLDPALPISSPPEFAAQLARASGRFYTQGMPEDTKALAAGVLTAEEFLQQAELVFAQRRRMFRAALADFSRGFLFFYFGTSDQLGHMFYRAQDPTHPARTAGDERHAQVLARTYRRLDSEVGLARKQLGPDDLLLVISDHGFGPASYQFDVNLWLQKQGYLAQRRGHALPGVLGHLDWSKTRAYGLGLNGLYLNLQGREAHGVVPTSARDRLLTRLTAQLLALKHPATGQPVVTEVVRPRRALAGPRLQRAPDLIVGYARGFKVNDASAMGAVGPNLYELNRGAWSGDHCGDHRLVPGVLASNRKLRGGPFQLIDMAPTILRYLGQARPPAWPGRSVLKSSTADN